jgi:O-antigen/teichoic acid export membrane protein
VSILLRHSAVYLLARSVPGVINFLAIAIYTRLLSPEEYGRYVLVFSVVTFINIVLYDWLRLSLLRFVSGQSIDVISVKSTVFTIFLTVNILTLLVGIILYVVNNEQTWRMIVVVSVLLLWTQAWFDLHLQSLRAGLQPLQYGVVSWVRAFVSLGVGIVLVKYFHLSFFAPLVGFLVGNVCAGLINLQKEWSAVRLDMERRIACVLFSYGLPLVITQFFSFALGLSDRFLIAAMIDEAAAGVYAATYDFVQQVSTFLLSTFSLAAYPLLVRSHEQGPRANFRAQAKVNICALLLLSAPIVILLALYSTPVASAYFGSDYRNTAATLIPWLAAAMLLSNVRSLHFDIAFQISNRTTIIALIVGSAASANIVLNILLIPIWGLKGAAYSTVASFMLALLLSVVAGQRVLPMPFPLQEVGKVIAGCAAMIGVLLVVERLPMLLESHLVFKVTLGLLAYVGTLWAMDAAHVRRKAMARLQHVRCVRSAKIGIGR